MMFEIFNNMLNNDERIQFTVTRKGNQLAVLVQPVLQGAADEKAPEAIQTLRAALSMPLYVVTDPLTLDADFPRSLAKFADVRESVHDDLEKAIRRIEEAVKQVNTNMIKSKEMGKSTEKSGYEQQDQDDNMVKLPTEIAENTKSLF